MIHSPNLFHGAAILENMPVTRSKDSTLFREISREIFVVRVDRTATCVGFREMLWPNARKVCICAMHAAGWLRAVRGRLPDPGKCWSARRYLFRLCGCRWGAKAVPASHGRVAEPVPWTGGCILHLLFSEPRQPVSRLRCHHQCGEYHRCSAGCSGCAHCPTMVKAAHAHRDWLAQPRQTGR